MNQNVSKYCYSNYLTQKPYHPQKALYKDTLVNTSLYYTNEIYH